MAHLCLHSRRVHRTMKMEVSEKAIAAGSLLLRDIAAFNKRIVTATAEMLKRTDLRALGTRYQAAILNREVDLSFNLFAIVSDLYYRENFHSDVLRAMLDPKSRHRDGDRFLRLFLDFLTRHKAAVDPDHYQEASVVREEGRIDILITDAISKKAIVIENKINGAADMPKQLPRYVNFAKESGFEVDAIAYLRLDRRQHPDKKDWTAAERKEIDPKLLCLSAYDESDDDLLNGWLMPCENTAHDSNAKAIFKQYGELITKLGRKTMNKPIMRQFYALMREGDAFQNAQCLRAMLDELVLFRVENIIESFKADLAPFESVANWKDSDAYFTGCYWDGGHLGIDVIVEVEEYRFQFWDRDDDEGKNGRARRALKEMGILGDYTKDGGLFVKTFKFPNQEDALFGHIKKFKTMLGRFVANSGKLPGKGT